VTHTTYARPVIPLLIAYGTGLAAGARFPGYGAWAWILAGLVLGALIYTSGRRQKAAVTPLVLFSLCGYLAIQAWVAPNFSTCHVSRFADTRHPWRIAGSLVAPPLHQTNRTTFVLKVDTLSAGQKVIPAIGRIRVSVYGDAPLLKNGDAVVFDSPIRAIRNFNNPGAFNYQRFMAFKNVWGTAYTRADNLHIEHSATNGLQLDDIRNRIAAVIDGIESPRVSSVAKAVLKALIIGDRRALAPEWRTALNRAGIGHLLAISGLHIGIIATVSFWILRRLLSLWKVALWRAWVNKGAAVLTLIPVLAYGALAGFSPSTQRAVCMVGVFLLAFLIEREPDGFNTLAVAAMAILLVHPPSLLTVSFQLSFAAVLAILLGLSLREQPLYAPGASRGRRLACHLWSMGFISLLATAGTLPLVMYYFNLVSLVGWVTNVVVVPLVGLAVIPLGLLAVCVCPLSVGLAQLLWQGCLELLDRILSMVKHIADMPWAAVQTVTPSSLEIVCYYMLWLGLLLVLKGGRDANEERDRRQARWGRLVFGTVLVVMLGDVGYWSYQRFGHRDLAVTVIDVGQGSATLMELPGGRTVLVDGGGFGDNRSFDVGARIVAPLLWRKKIMTVETIVLSHPNSDHLNGLIFIAENFNVQECWTTGEPADTMGYRKFENVLKRNAIRVPTFKKAARQRVINGVTFETLYPPCDFLARRAAEPWRTTNNNSLVLKARYGRRTFLMPGDIMARGEAELVALHGGALKSSVLLAPHHGSRTASTERLLNQVKPDVVVISAGWQNRFGFPHAVVLRRLQKHACRVFRTDQQGAVTIRTDGTALTVKSQAGRM
jgi:competence protein ComEC